MPCSEHQKHVAYSLFATLYMTIMFSNVIMAGTSISNDNNEDTYKCNMTHKITTNVWLLLILILSVAPLVTIILIVVFVLSDARKTFTTILLALLTLLMLAETFFIIWGAVALFYCGEAFRSSENVRVIAIGLIQIIFNVPLFTASLDIVRRQNIYENENNDELTQNLV